MGELISLSERRRLAPNRRAGRPHARVARPTFSFDLALPETYLAAERVDRYCHGLRWQPASAQAVGAGFQSPGRAAAMAAAEERAAALGLPLIWPDPFPMDVRPAMRCAARACELGRGAAFVLAASRLAFCGGFALSDPEVLAEAAAASGVPLDECLVAAGELSRDRDIEAAGRRLVAMGADALPALRVGRRLFSGEARLPEALAAIAAAG
ncbi:MAG: hypothetical protein QOF12_1058 [Solirubrobacteraceae bacterium]|jgi:2-hydroxychromene-2-carboxylate isomerase|nr:hypothetical protein [Solirubrobacteraceae bacterium]